MVFRSRLKVGNLSDRRDKVAVVVAEDDAKLETSGKTSVKVVATVVVSAPAMVDVSVV